MKAISLTLSEGDLGNSKSLSKKEGLENTQRKTRKEMELSLSKATTLEQKFTILVPERDKKPRPLKPLGLQWSISPNFCEAALFCGFSSSQEMCFLPCHIHASQLIKPE